MSQPATNIQPPSGSRLYLGGAIFITGFLAPLAIPLVTASDFSTEMKAVISGVLALGIPEVFMLIAVAILGKSGFEYLKSKIWKRMRPADKVGVTRYRIGLVMFFSPIIFGWSQPYLEQWLPGFEDGQIMMALIGDLVFASSLFVLGGDFWRKIKALFTHEAG